MSKKYAVGMRYEADRGAYAPYLLINLSTYRVRLIHIKNQKRPPDMIIKTYSEVPPMATDTLGWRVEQDARDQLIYWLHIWLPEYVWPKQMELFTTILSLAEVYILKEEMLFSRPKYAGEPLEVRFILPGCLDEEEWHEILANLGMDFSYIVTDTMHLLPVATLSLSQLAELLRYVKSCSLLNNEQLLDLRPVPIEMKELAMKF